MPLGLYTGKSPHSSAPLDSSTRWPTWCAPVRRRHLRNRAHRGPLGRPRSADTRVAGTQNERSRIRPQQVGWPPLSHIVRSAGVPNRRPEGSDGRSGIAALIVAAVARRRTSYPAPTVVPRREWSDSAAAVEPVVERCSLQAQERSDTAREAAMGSEVGFDDWLHPILIAGDQSLGGVGSCGGLKSQS